MTLSRLASLFGRAAKLTRDVNAVRRGRSGQRIVNKAIGRTAARLLRKAWL